jgi:hypothetical protein
MQAKPDINECDLRRTPNTCLSREELIPLYGEAIGLGQGLNTVLKLGGPVRDEICEFVQRVSVSSETPRRPMR